MEEEKIVDIDECDDGDEEMFALEQEEDDGSISGDLSEEMLDGFSGQIHLDGFSFPGDEKDWSN